MFLLYIRATVLLPHSHEEVKIAKYLDKLHVFYSLSNRVSIPFPLHASITTNSSKIFLIAQIGVPL